MPLLRLQFPRAGAAGGGRRPTGGSAGAGLCGRPHGGLGKGPAPDMGPQNQQHFHRRGHPQPAFRPGPPSPAGRGAPAPAPAAGRGNHPGGQSRHGGGRKIPGLSGGGGESPVPGHTEL